MSKSATKKKKHIPISDYKDYNYKKQFWDNHNREYEHQLESQLLKSRLKKYMPNKIVDVGCGFGRLFPTYSQFGHKWVLIDYAENLLKDAENNIPDSKKPHTTCIQGSFYDLPIANESTDFLFSIRTMHHMEQPDIFFEEAHRVLKQKGTLFIEIPNKRHIKNLIKLGLGIGSTQKRKEFFELFNDAPLALGPTYFNFHPKFIIKRLEQTGFEVKRTTSTSFFRSTLLKKICKAETLVGLDRIAQSLLSWVFIAPSVYVECEKK